ncbi:MAG: hypothetical protein D6808_02500 [Candidatus Dadabacteria bacterium]|nr:MAG: hypothetical protein D6808_02500 [Candidatus Dadabacteria bacterium]
MASGLEIEVPNLELISSLGNAKGRLDLRLDKRLYPTELLIETTISLTAEGKHYLGDRWSLYENTPYVKKVIFR